MQHSLNLFVRFAAAFAFALVVVALPHAAEAASATLSVSPGSVQLGASATVTWNSEGTFSCVGNGFSTNNATSGSVQVTPSSSGTKTYAVLCYTSSSRCSFQGNLEYGGLCTRELMLSGGCLPQYAQCSALGDQCLSSCQIVGAHDTLTVTAAPKPERSVRLTATPITVNEGQSTLLSWNSSGAAFCSGTNFSTGGAVSGSVTNTPTGDTTYTVTCTAPGETTSGTSGTWQLYDTDASDLWCGTTRRPNAYGAVPDCPSSSPAGTACTGSGACKVNSFSTNSCILSTKIYQCTGATSGSTPEKFSDTASVTYNANPLAPTISGPTTGQTGESYDFSFVGSDPDGDRVRYRIDWDGKTSADQSLPASGYVASRTSRSTSYSWNTPGTYTFRALTQDEHSALSGWTTHTIVIADPVSDLSASCSVSPSTATVGEAVTWSASASGGTGSYAYAWSGTDGLSGSKASVSKSYSTAGNKSGAITVNDGKDSITKSCGNSVSVSDPGDPGDPGTNPDTGGDTPGTTGTPQCSDGIDNNGNGLIDEADVDSCTGPNDPIEDPIPEAVLSLLTASDLIRSGDSTTLNWQAEHTQSCTLFGDNGDSWALSGTVGTQLSSPLEAETSFTLSCVDLKGHTVSTTVKVRITPSFKEVLRNVNSFMGAVINAWF